MRNTNVKCYLTHTSCLDGESRQDKPGNCRPRSTQRGWSWLWLCQFELEQIQYTLALPHGAASCCVKFRLKIKECFCLIFQARMRFIYNRCRDSREETNPGPCDFQNCKETDRQRECMFSPGISKDIKELIFNCSTCIKYAKQQAEA